LLGLLNLCPYDKVHYPKFINQFIHQQLADEYKPVDYLASTDNSWVYQVERKSQFCQNGGNEVVVSSTE